MPANSVRLLNHSDPSASLQPVVYVLPAAYAQVPLSPPPNYDTVIAAPSGNYSLIPTAPPAKYSSIPTAPPPAYDQVMMKKCKSLEEFEQLSITVHRVMS